jgi:hypothetical protein
MTGGQYPSEPPFSRLEAGDVCTLSRLIEASIDPGQNVEGSPRDNSPISGLNDMAQMHAPSPLGCEGCLDAVTRATAGAELMPHSLSLADVTRRCRHGGHQLWPEVS